MRINIRQSWRNWLLASTAISICYFIVIISIPNIVPVTPHDDGLFLKLALRISQGQWLGDQYNSLTLAKGPFHSWQMATAYRLGISPGFWLNCFYLFSAWLFCTLAMPACRWWLRSLCFLAFLLDPWQFTSFGLRLLREQTYIPLMIIALSLMIYSMDRICWPSIDFNRLKIPDNLRLVAGLSLSGFAMGLLLITREARVVIYATIVFSLVLFMGILFSYRRKIKGKISVFIVILISLLLLVPLPLSLVSYRNTQVYGYPLTNEFEEGSFKAFYQDLISIRLKADNYKPWVPLTLSTMDSLQETAPKTKLSSILADLNPNWKRFGCEQHKEACGEYGGGWLMWALRDSLFQQTAIDSPIQLQVLIDHLRADIKTICKTNSQLYDCRRTAWGYLPFPSRWGHDRSISSLLLSEFTNKLKGSFLPQLISYPAANYESIEAQSKFATKLRVRTVSLKSDQIQWSYYVSSLYSIGSLLRVSFVLFVLFLILKLHVPVSEFAYDPGILLIGFIFTVQVLIFSLVELSSFHTGGYLIIVSPLITAFFSRLLAVGQKSLLI